jgi:hypothetical protein
VIAAMLSAMTVKKRGDPTPCVGCGYCCIAAICEYGRENVETHQCAYLYFKDGRYWCDAAGPKKWFGAGCSCSLNSWRKDVRWRGANE